MEGAKIPILEVEKITIKDNGRGCLFHDSGRMTKDWLGCSYSGGTVGGKQFICAASSAGWLKIHIISGSTYGPTGASYYIPLYRTRNTFS